MILVFNHKIGLFNQVDVVVGVNDFYSATACGFFVFSISMVKS